MKTRFIFTDIHGNFLTFMALIGKVAYEAGVDKQFVVDNMTVCGDLQDRGELSKQVIQFCIDNDVDVAMGNHELMMLDGALRAFSYYTKNGWWGNDMWVQHGGRATMDSYLDIVPEWPEHGASVESFDMTALLAHLKWMKKLPYYIEYPELKTADGRYLVCSHSNIHNVWKHRNSEDKEKKNSFEEQVVWARPTKVKDCFDIFNVFGHTPQQNGPRIRVPFANIDTGCFYKEEEGYFQLTCLQFPEMKVYSQENIDG